METVNYRVTDTTINAVSMNAKSRVINFSTTSILSNMIKTTGTVTPTINKTSKTTCINMNIILPRM